VQDAARNERLLYLTGDKNHDMLSRMVKEGLGDSILSELRVYATYGVLDFGSHARALGGEMIGTLMPLFFCVSFHSRRSTGRRNMWEKRDKLMNIVGSRDPRPF
jgi:hypothetical protein